MTMQTPENKQWVAVVPVPQSQRAPAPDRKYIGDGHDILLQGFHWASHAGARDHGSRAKKSWYRVLKDNAAAIKAAGFTWVWFPPPSDSLSPQGYIPRRWNVLNTPYGSEHELREAIEALEPVKALADVVLNHRVGVATGGADFDDPPFPDNRSAIARDDESGVGTGNRDTGEKHPAGAGPRPHQRRGASVNQDVPAPAGAPWASAAGASTWSRVTTAGSSANTTRPPIRISPSANTLTAIGRRSPTGSMAPVAAARPSTSRPAISFMTPCSTTIITACARGMAIAWCAAA